MNKLLKQAAFPEAYIWLGGLLFLALITPGDGHWSVCPLSMLNFDGCPGCGLGTSVSHLLHGNISASWESHILGIPALFLLTGRISQLFYISLTKNTYGKSY